MIRAFLILDITTVISACSSQTAQQSAGQEAAIEAGSGANRTIALLGATGMVGTYVLQEALSQGYAVRALARTPAKLDLYKEEITIVQGDARDLSAIRTLLLDSDIVLSALGPVRADGGAAQMISTVATGHVLNVMEESVNRRYIVVSGGAVVVPGDERNFTGWLMRKMVSITLRDTLKDKQAEYELLAKSAVAWTLVRCPLILDEPYRHAASASLETPDSFTLRAGELARFMIGEIDAGEFSGTAPFLYSE
jgi:putative NADH-flavin reductase